MQEITGWLGANVGGAAVHPGDPGDERGGGACLVHRAWRARTARSLPPLQVSCGPLPEVATGKLSLALLSLTKRRKRGTHSAIWVGSVVLCCRKLYMAKQFFSRDFHLRQLNSATHGRTCVGLT